MPVPVPFGQFVPGDSAVHRLDPRAKIALTLAFTILLFSSRGWAGLAVGAVVALAVVAVSRVPWRLAMRGLIPIVWLLMFTLIANALAGGPGPVLAHIAAAGG